MLRHAVHSSPLSLFHASSSEPLALFSAAADADLPEDAGLVLVRDATDEAQWQVVEKQDESGKASALKADKGSTVQLKGLSKSGTRAADTASKLVSLDGLALQLQSPNIIKTYIRSPPLACDALEIKLGFMHMNFRLLGTHRHFMFEVGVEDRHGKRARLRFSTFCTKPKLQLLSKASTDLQQSQRDEPLLHMPLRCPTDAAKDPTVLTAWNNVCLPLHTLAKHLKAPELLSAHRVGHRDELGGRGTSWPTFEAFDNVVYVKVHANCRLQRIWFTEHASQAIDMPAFQLIAST